MIGRLQRIDNTREHHPETAAKSANDVAGLIRVLKIMLDSN
jgi:hypothetical protein